MAYPQPIFLIGFGSVHPHPLVRNPIFKAYHTRNIILPCFLQCVPLLIFLKK